MITGDHRLGGGRDRFDGAIDRGRRVMRGDEKADRPAGSAPGSVEEPTNAKPKQALMQRFGVDRRTGPEALHREQRSAERNAKPPQTGAKPANEPSEAYAQRVAGRAIHLERALGG